MKTFINWQGNKSKHINKFINYIPEFTGTYIEPFVGSGALFLNLEPKKWIINDLNKDLINIWKCVKDNPEYLIENFKEFGKKFKKMSNERKLEYCKELTQTINKMPFKIKRSLNYLLMKHCAYLGNIVIKNEIKFPSLKIDIVEKKYSFLKQVYFNNLTNISDFLHETKGKIYNKDYSFILNKAKNGDFVFLDPPYIEKKKYQFNYNKNEIIDEKFLKELLVQVKKLDKKGVMWLMTQANTKQVRDTFKGYTMKKIGVYRAAAKSHVKELIIMNYKI